MPTSLLLGPGEAFGRSMGDGKMRSDGGGGRMIHHGGPTNRCDDVPERFHQEPPRFSSQRSDRFHYKSWDSNPEHVPKGRAYFEVSKESKKLCFVKLLLGTKLRTVCTQFKAYPHFKFHFQLSQVNSVSVKFPPCNVLLSLVSSLVGISCYEASFRQAE
jgi:hypothetical protein